MRKSFFKTSMIILIAALCLTGCSGVYDAAISGTVKDRSASSSSTSSTAGVIADAMVFAYDSESAWNNAYNSYDGKSVFSDNSVPSAKTASDGSFSIATLRWKTNNPAYGKDADSKVVYLLVFHKDYGLTKVDGRTVQSDKSNNFGIVYLDKVTTVKNLEISFKDKDYTGNGSDNITSTSDFSYRYEYNDGYETVSGTVSTITNGTSSLTVKYKEKNDDGSDATPPAVTVYDIQSGSDWTYKGDDKVTMSYNKTTKSYENNSLYFTNDWETVAVTLNLKDGSSTNQDSSISDSIDLTWKYDNGDNTTKTDRITVVNGTATVNVKYKKTASSSCTITFSDFEASNENTDNWSKTKSKADGTATDEDVSFTVDGSKDSVTCNIYFKRKYLVVPSSGFSGYAVKSIGTGSGYGDSSDNGNSICMFNDSALSEALGKSVYTAPENVTSTSTTITYNGHYTGVAANERIALSYSDAASYKSDSVPLYLGIEKRGGTSFSSFATVYVDSTTTDFNLSVKIYS